MFSVIAGWQREAVNEGRKLSLAKCFKRYVDERLKGTGDEQTIKTTYNRGKAIAEDEIELLGAIAERGVVVACTGQQELLNDQNVALIAQLVEHLTCNQGVRRSNRRGGTIFAQLHLNCIVVENPSKYLTFTSG